MDEQFQKRIRDLANRSYQKSQYTFTNFLSEAELSEALELERELGAVGMTFWGGTENCTRQVLRFGREEQLGYAEEFPIVCVIVTPLSYKFGEELSHRDYLGALMNLGIERDTIGDIIIHDKTAYVFCLEQVSVYILENLSKIRHTNMKVEIAQEIPEAAEPHIEQLEVQVSSERLDGVLSKLLNLSRSESLLLFSEKKVYVNGRCFENNSQSLKPGDLVSVRGYGKFVYEGMVRETKKGKLRISIGCYR